MRNFGLWLFILSLPLLAAIGHDGYMAYNNPKSVDAAKPLPFSDAGWVWQRRAYDSWRWAHDKVDPKVWEEFVKPVLNQKTILVAAAPLVLFLFIILLFKLFGFGPYAGNGLLIRRSHYLSRRDDGGPPRREAMRYKRR